MSAVIIAFPATRIVRSKQDQDPCAVAFKDLDRESRINLLAEAIERQMALEKQQDMDDLVQMIRERVRRAPKRGRKPKGAEK